MKPPSTSWREDVAPDEAERFQRYADGLVALQQRRSAKAGAGRALHRHALAALRGELEVLAELPEAVRHGLFATAGKHDAWVRLSNGSMDHQPDRKPDVRGFALKVLGVEGESALGGPAKAQDFTLINHPAFSVAKAADFAELVLALGAGPWSLLKYLVGKHGVFGAIREAKKAGAVFGRPFTGFATEPFYSAVPIACGPYAARVRLRPPAGTPTPGARRDWAADLRARLPVVYTLELQLFVDEATTPIEDASVDWPEGEAPFVAVARLTVPSQASDAAFADAVEKAVFDPWNALLAHRPLGDVMRARKVAYFASQQARGAG